MNENENNISLEDLRNSYLENTGAADTEVPETAGQADAPGDPETTAAEPQGAAQPGEQAESDGAPQPGYDERFGTAMDMSAQNDRMNELMAENAALKEQLSQASAQASTNAENVGAAVAETLTGEDLPQFDDEAYSFASDAERREIMSAYTKSLIDYAVKKAQSDVLNRVAPLVDEYDRAVENAEFDKALTALGASAEFEDIGSYKDDIRRLSEREEFKGMKPYQRATLAALIAKGMHASPAAKNEPDIGTRVDEILNDPALMKELEMRRARKMNDSRGDYPAQSASGGLSSAAYQPPRKAQSIEELREMYARS